MSMVFKYLDKAALELEKRKKIKTILKIIIIIIAIAFALYLRSISALEIAAKYGPEYALELQGNDPWIEYWVANYTYHHGILSWWTLKPTDPVAGPIIRKFWYPWGRDITMTTYPGISVFSALTYPIVQNFGLTLKDWIALQPLFYATITVIFVYLAVKELMDGSELAGLAAALIYSILPAAADRTMVSFTEKEGAALPFAFLFIYFYSKMIKTPYTEPKKKIMYSLFAGLSMAMVGWFWGGFQYLFIALSGFIILYPLVSKEEVKLEFILYNLIITLSSIVFVSIAPTSLKVLGIYPFTFKGLGILAILAYLLPVTYWYFKVKKRIFTKATYFGILLFVGILVIVGIGFGYIRFGGRLLYAVTPPPLRGFVHLSPLVESIEEHQPAFRAHGLIGVLYSWGYIGFLLSILGALYLFYKGRPDHLLISVIFLIAFYAYMNATYFEAAAATFGVVTIAAFISFLLTKLLPEKKHVKTKKRKRSRTVVTIREKGIGTRIFALFFLIIVAISSSIATARFIDEHKHMLPSIFTAGSGIGPNDAWYETIEFIRNSTSKDALFVTWWDYGYWITVNTGRATLADGATFNGSQIKLLAKVLTSFDEKEVLDILRNKLHAPDETYILVFDVFMFIPFQNNTYIVRPYFPPGQLRMVGRVDIPKSIWMIRIGERDASKYLYLYKFSNTDLLISPQFDKPKDLPLIYKMMVDGILYLNIQENMNLYGNISQMNITRYVFQWWTGQETGVELVYRRYVSDLNVTREITTNYQNVVLFGDQPNEINIASMKYIKPYKIIHKPFQNYKNLQVVIFIYKVDFSGLKQ